jgi:hypothetical protein
MRLFQEVEEVMHSAVAGRDAAIRLLADLDWVRPDSSERLSMLNSAIPALSAVRQGESAVDHKLFEGMALTVLDGIATSRTG